MKNWELINFCEFDEKPTKAYCAIHNINEKLNLGDITKVDETKLKDFNMICGGSPCQDFSIAGKQKGSMWTCKECGYEYNPITQHYSKRDCCPNCGSKELDKSRSSLLVEWLRIVRANKPNWGIYENVKNITNGKHRQTFDLFVQELEEYGYNVYWKILKANGYGIPQERERVYVLFIKKELDNKKFNFPVYNAYSTNGIVDILDKEEEIREKDYHICPSMLKAINDGKCKIIKNNQSSKTVTTKQNRWNNAGFVKGEKGLRFFTPKETFKLMGFTNEDFYKAQSVIKSDDSLYKFAGNSIVVNVLYEIYKEIYKAMPYLFDDLKVGSYFSGIGAFEKALDKLYEDINKGEI